MTWTGCECQCSKLRIALQDVHVSRTEGPAPGLRARGHRPPSWVLLARSCATAGSPACPWEPLFFLGARQEASTRSQKIPVCDSPGTLGPQAHRGGRPGPRKRNRPARARPTGARMVPLGRRLGARLSLTDPTVSFRAHRPRPPLGMEATLPHWREAKACRWLPRPRTTARA